jgi:hypothetical protein
LRNQIFSFGSRETNRSFPELFSVVLKTSVAGRAIRCT